MKLSWINPLPRKFGFFVSHSSQDRGAAISLCSALKAYGVPTWLSSGEERIGSGNWERQVQDALRSEGAFLLLVSDVALASKEVRNEIDLARALGRSFFIVGLDGQDKARKALEQNGYMDLCKQVIIDGNHLERQEAHDPYDQCARGLADHLRNHQALGNLRSMGVLFAAILAVFYFAGPLTDSVMRMTKAVMTPSAKVADVAPASSVKHKSSTAPVERKQVAEVPAVAAAPIAASAPSVAAARPFALPRFLKQPSIPIRSRLLASWGASSEALSFNADLRFNADMLQGSVVTVNKKTSERCSYQVHSTAVEEGYVKLVPDRSSAGCSLKALHIGYRNEELIQVVFEGGALSSQIVSREL